MRFTSACLLLLAAALPFFAAAIPLASPLSPNDATSPVTPPASPYVYDDATAHLPHPDSLSAPRVRANTTLGWVEGYINKRVRTFRGIPYAAPPVQQNRFRPPQPAEPWDGIRPAHAQGHICPQFHLSKHTYLGKEDCLTLSVYVPHALPAEPLPVLFWIFGGGWVVGDGYEFGLYDATTLARERNAIVVTPNYRLGALGLLALEELAGESEDGQGIGNMALKDQRAALRWVRENIAEFGGDPDRVTLFGESAGAFSVCFHLASPASHGLFAGAIMQSGSCDSPHFFVPRADSVAWSRTFLRSVGCDPDSPTLLQCLRGKPADALVAPPALREAAAAWAAFPPTDANVQSSAVDDDDNVNDDDNEGLGADADGIAAAAAALPPSATAGTTAPLSSATAAAAGDFASVARSALAASMGLEDAAELTAVPPSARHSHNVNRNGNAGGDKYVPPLYPLMPWSATIDGSRAGLLSRPLTALAAGEGAPVPVLVGTNRDEGSMFTFAVPFLVPRTLYPLRPKDLPAALKHFFGPDFDTDAALRVYPAKSFKNTSVRTSRIIRDFMFTCPSRRMALARSPFARAALHKGAPPAETHMYHFTYNSKWIETIILGVYHASELPFVFHNEWPCVVHGFKKADHAIAGTFGAYWGAFSAAGDPNAAAPTHAQAFPSTDPSGVPMADPRTEWPAFGKGNETVLVIDSKLRVEQDMFAKECEFWDNALYNITL